jgi:hypothetical protein
MIDDELPTIIDCKAFNKRYDILDGFLRGNLVEKGRKLMCNEDAMHDGITSTIQIDLLESCKAFLPNDQVYGEVADVFRESIVGRALKGCRLGQRVRRWDMRRVNGCSYC